MIAGCAVDTKVGQQANVRTVTKTVVKKLLLPSCPTDDQLRDAAIEVSIATYRKAPGSSRSCACPGDRYIRQDIERDCTSFGTFVMCNREQVPGALLNAMKDRIPACRSDN